MPVFLDDEAVEFDGEDLAAVLDSVRRRLEGEGRVVVEIQLDGQILSDDFLERSASTRVDRAELRLVSADPKALAVSTLEQMRGRLAEAGDIQAEAADLLQHDQTPEAFERVAEAVEIWLQTQQVVVQSAGLNDLDLNEIRVDDQPVSAFTDGLIKNLRTLKELITNRDTVGLADVLAYEWPGVVDQWDRLLERLTEVMEAGGVTGDTVHDPGRSI